MPELVAIGFDQPHKADHVLTELRRLEKEYLVDLEDAVVAIRPPDDKVQLKQSISLVGAGAASGGLAGASLALLAPWGERGPGEPAKYPVAVAGVWGGATSTSLRNRVRALSAGLALILAIPLAATPALAQMTPEQRTELLLNEMTLEQKVQQIHNLPLLNEELQDEDQPCDFTDVGRHIEGIPELGIPTFRFANGGTGIRGGDCVPEPVATAIPSGVALAATFDREAAFALGEVLDEEINAWAHHALWGPGVNLIRHPYGGRGYEYMSEDPYLSGVIATEQVRGVQASGRTHATIKHYAVNEQEEERWTMQARVRPRAMHEIYLLPFEMVVKDGDVAAVMCSFPMINGEQACDSQPLLVDTLRERWGFDGYVVSDRRSTHSTVPSILAGNDFELDFEPEHYTLEKIEAAIAAGEITEGHIDDLLRERYVKMFEYGHFDTPYDEFLFETVDYEANGAVARQAAEESIVLLKNEGDLLPLDASALDSIALIGAEWFAGEATLTPRSSDTDELSTVVAPYTITPEEGLNNTLAELGAAATVTYDDGTDIASAAELAADSDVAIVMVGDTPRETVDKESLSLPTVTDTDQEELVPAILAANPNTVVVLKTQGMVLMPWLADAPAVVEAWYPGQEDGNVVADVLFGVVNPSGKLPVTFGNTPREAAYATEAQYPGVRVDNGLGPDPDDRFEHGGTPQLVALYTEGLHVGYRWYEANAVEPVYAFGHGLSYTDFEYSNLRVTRTRPDPQNPGHWVVSVAYTITNIGAVAGKEASQVYVTLPEAATEPSKRLVGFEKVELAPGQSQRVSVAIDPAASNHPLSYFLPDNPGDLATWAEGRWVTPAGGYTFHVGTSSADIALENTIGLPAPAQQGRRLRRAG